ncbi:MAG: GGDEF domain-containing protein [Actinomycetota bacterium]|nr:GGDEF domain-containing protein [Actinomycetota bacterium]
MNNKKLAIPVFSIIAFLAAIGLYFLSLYNFLLYHLIVEFLAMSIGIFVFVIAINTINITSNVFILLIGTTFFTSAILDFLHTITFKGMNILPIGGTNIASQLWISARFVQAVGLLAGAFIINLIVTKRCKIFIASGFSAYFILSVLFILILRIFPTTFIEGQGLTSFKKIMEYIIIFILLLSIIFYSLNREKLGKKGYYYVIASIAFFIISEFLFTLYHDDYGIYNTIGHLLKIGSYIFFYMLLIRTNLIEPLTLLAGNLRSANEKLQDIASHDSLTGLLNHNGVFKEMHKQFEVAKRFKKDFSIIMFDIDDFKKINDIKGHPVGNEALKFIAKIINQSVRSLDIKGRYGGDEFIISPIEAGEEEALRIAQKIQNNLEEKPLPAKCYFERFTVSMGISIKKNDRAFNEIINIADKALLQSKTLGKNRITLL